MKQTKTLTHLDSEGRASMVDVTEKAVTARIAVAQGMISMQADTLAMIQEGGLKKGDVLAVARVAGIQGAKRCSELIPLCHPLALSSIKVEFEMDLLANRVLINATCKLEGKTGVEMEALTAVTVAALTIYDMCKAVDKGMQIGEVQLLSKSGGRSGDWQR